MAGTAGEWSRWVWVTKICVTVSLRTASSKAPMWRVATRLPVVLRQHVHRRRVAGEIHRLEMFQGRGVEGQIPWQQVNGREKQRVVCQVAPPESFRRFGLARRHNHFAGELAPPVVFGDTRRVPVERSEEHTSELQSLRHLVCRLLLEKKKNHL